MANEITLEIVTTNVKSKARKVTLQGRSYSVAQGTIIKEGVLNGSKGKLFYSKAEIEKNPNDWNGMPIVGYHPIINGRPVSARDPTILEKHGLGHVYKAKAKDGSLRVEYWFDDELTSNFDQYLDDEHKIMPRLANGEPIETSTGVYTTDVKAEDGATFNGEPYDFNAINYKPDHVAVLPDEIGACSVADGCGVCVNSSSLMKKITDTVKDWFSKVKSADVVTEEPTANELSHDQIRDQLRQALRSNYTQDMPSCYIMEVYDDYFIYEMGYDTYSMNYSTSDTGVELSGEASKVVREVSYKPVTMETNMALTANQRKEKVDYLTANCSCWKNGQQVLNALNDDQLAHIEAQEKAKTPTPPTINEQVEAMLPLLKEKLGIKDPTPVVPPVTAPATPPVAQPLTANEWLAAAPVEVRAVYEDTLLARNHEKANLVQILTNNVKDDASKQQLTTYFNTKDVSELRILARAYPQQTSMPLYPGSPPAINSGTPDPDETEPLLPPTINYSEEVANRKKTA